MIRRIFNCICVLALVAPTSAYARLFVQGYSDWKLAPPNLQAAYLQGAVDGWFLKAPGVPEWMVARDDGLIDCIVGQKINAQMMVEIVNSHYAEYKMDWRISPAVVLQEELQGICLADINKARLKVGLGPWSRLPGQISKDRP